MLYVFKQIFFNIIEIDKIIDSTRKLEAIRLKKGYFKISTATVVKLILTDRLREGLAIPIGLRSCTRHILYTWYSSGTDEPADSTILDF